MIKTLGLAKSVDAIAIQLGLAPVHCLVVENIPIAAGIGSIGISSSPVGAANIVLTKFYTT